MPRCILDTSVCVDLANAGLLKVALRLSHILELPDVIAEELQEPSGKSLIELGYASVSLPTVNRVIALTKKYRKPSTNDLFALACAIEYKCVLLTGDADLRRAANEENAEVHGILWLLDELLKEGIIRPTDAIRFLGQILDGGSRLPRRECEERFERWRKM